MWNQISNCWMCNRMWNWISNWISNFECESESLTNFYAAIFASFLKDLGFSNVLHSLIRVEILQYLSKSWLKYHRIDTDASFLGSIQTQNSIDVVLWSQFFQKISLMSHCGSISAKKIVLMSRCWSKYCLKKIVLWLWYCSEPISLPPESLLLDNFYNT